MRPARQQAEQDEGFIMKVFDFHSRDGHAAAGRQAEHDGGLLICVKGRFK